MRLEVMALNVPASGIVTAGAAQLVRDLNGKTVQFVGGSGQWSIEISLDGTNFVPAITGIVAAGIFELRQACSFVRVKPVTNTTAPVVLLGGYSG